MSEFSRLDNIRRIVDQDQEEIPLITLSKQNTLMFKLQINIQDSILPPSDIPFHSFQSLTFNNPTPCQYAIIANKPNSLKVLLNFMKDDYQEFIGSEGSPKKTLEIFFPDVSNTTWPLLHLAVALGRSKCIEILIKFLDDQKETKDYINRPDDNQRTPLAIAFATGNKDIIKQLLDIDSDPFYGVDQKIFMPLIYTCLHYPDQVQTAVDCIEEKFGDEKNILAELKSRYFDEMGFAYSSEIQATKPFSRFVSTLNSKVCEIFSKMSVGAEIISTPANEEDKVNNDHNQNSSQNCSFDGCNKKGNNYCKSCQKYFCEDHISEIIHNCNQ